MTTAAFSATRRPWLRLGAPARLRMAACMVLLAIAGACAAMPAIAQSCGPGVAGSPCATGQIAGMDSTGGVGQAAGNPINIITGNKYQREADMPALPGMLGLELVRHYNSRLAAPGMPLQGIGRGWQFSYDTRLHVQGNTLQIVQADGARIIFARSAWSRTVCTTSDPAQGRVRIARSGGRPEYRWHWPNGRELTFDHHGRLVRISDSNGMEVVIERMEDGRISVVTDPQGRSMTFHYLHRKDDRPGRYRGVQSVDTPVGRFLYDYGDAGVDADTSAQAYATLSAVHLPTRYDPAQPRPAFRLGDTPATNSVSTVRRIYHHEDNRFPTLLTGITIDGAGSDGKPMHERIATWAYDRNGMAVLSVRHEAAWGPKAPEAGSAGERLTFDRSEPGRTRVTDGQGRVTTYRHAIVAGAFRVLEARGAGCASCGPVNVRYHYDRHGRLEEVVTLDKDGTPVAGRRQQLDALGRPYALKLLGYRRGPQPPHVALVLRQQFPYPRLAAAGPGAVNAPAHFGPMRVAEDSVVPGNTHEVRIAYNSRQQVLQVTETGYDPVSRSASTRLTRFRYKEIDGRSLLAEVDGPLANGPAGTPADSDITRYEWDARGAYVRKIILPMGPTLDITHDAHTGRPRTVRYRWDGVVRTSRYAYGSNGQVTRHHQTAYAADGTTVLAERDVALASNARNEISSITWPDGRVEAVMRRWSGNHAEWAPPANASLATVDPADVLRYDINGKSAERLIDDFGQVVGIRNPGQGWQYARYDAAGRITEMRDARGMVTSASHDAAGRLLGITRKLSGDAYMERLAFGWDGPHKVIETVETDQRRMHASHYTHTPWGQVSQKRVEIAAAAAREAPVSMTTASSYDAAGRLGTRTLPGGERLAYRYYATNAYYGQRAAVERLHWPRWLDWLMSRVPETWLDRSGLKTRLVDFAPHEAVAGAGAGPASAADVLSLSADQKASAPAAEPGIGKAAPGEQHDAAGLPRRIDTATGSFILRWNAASQLVSVRSAGAAPGNEIASYTYDAHGRRASKRSAAGAEYYLYEGTQLLAIESRPLHGPPRTDQYLYEGYRPIAWLRDGMALLLQTDHRGAVKAVTSAERESSARKTLWRGDPGPWGKSPITDAAANRYDPRLRLVNQLADEETGLSYHIARYYDPAAGRFISPDPAGIADTLDGDVPEALRVDLTAYAAGQPNRYFDPDGAARLIYYAMTTGANGKQLGVEKSNFIKARWAFSIDGIEASGDGGSDAINRLMEKYAKNQTGMLVDKDGNFIDGKKIAVSWNGENDETIDQFVRHYGANITRLSQFTIDGYSNRDAALLIAALTGNADEAALCSNRNSLLPPIPFAPEENPLLPTDTSLRQRILNCGDIDLKSITKEALRERMLIKLNQALSLNEVGKIYDDCSETGCPSIAAVFIAGPNKAAQRLPAAYSHLQFAPETLTEILLDNLMNQTLATSRYEISQDRLDQIFNGDSTKAEIVDASTRARWVYVYGYCMADQRNGYADKKMFCPDKNVTSSPWENLSEADKLTFTQRTGLDAPYWTFLKGRAAKTLINKIDYVNNTAYKEQLDAVAWAAWKTVDKANLWFANIAKDNSPGGKMEALAVAYLQIKKYQIINSGSNALNYPEKILYPLANNGKSGEQNQIDLEIAMRISRRHNGGRWWLSLNNLKSSENLKDPNDYVKKIIGALGFPDKGNYPALRCANKIQLPKNGLTMMPLNLI